MTKEARLPNDEDTVFGRRRKILVAAACLCFNRGVSVLSAKPSVRAAPMSAVRNRAVGFDIRASSFLCHWAFRHSSFNNVWGQPAIYDSTGNLQAADAQPQSRFMFTGREWNALTALSHHRARHYSPSLGRWTGPDPLVRHSGEWPELLIEGPNLVAYVGNQTTFATEPMGLDRWVEYEALGLHPAVIIQDPDNPGRYLRTEFAIIIGVQNQWVPRPLGEGICTSDEADRFAIQLALAFEERLPWYFYNIGSSAVFV